MAHLAQVLRESEQFEEATRWAMRAAEAGHTPTYVVLGLLLAELGDTARSEEWLRRGVDAGDPDAMLALGTRWE